MRPGLARLHIVQRHRLRLGRPGPEQQGEDGGERKGKRREEPGRAAVTAGAGRGRGGDAGPAGGPGAVCACHHHGFRPNRFAFPTRAV